MKHNTDIFIKLANPNTDYLYFVDVRNITSKTNKLEKNLNYYKLINIVKRHTYKNYYDRNSNKWAEKRLNY